MLNATRLGSKEQMEDLYSIHPGILRGGDTPAVGSASSCQGSSDASEVTGSSGGVSDLTDLIKAQIANHPRYPTLLSSYIECRKVYTYIEQYCEDNKESKSCPACDVSVFYMKVGAPPEVATLLEEIGKESYSSVGGGEIGADPELDEFMVCQNRRSRRDWSNVVGHPALGFSIFKGREGVVRSISYLEKKNLSLFLKDYVGVIGSSDEELSCGDLEISEGQERGSRKADHELKQMLLKKYSGYLTNLRKEFLKKRKKGKLPKDARLTLLDWWNSHCRWPYPTEEEKAKLAEKTGLNQKQINNWFINQRKRHWKPSEDMRFALMEGVSGGSGRTMLYFDSGTIGP
ncbi:hypothetical protein BHM03_00040706 [Ensete ventricosum]|nr:hypothetical protein BHM03_00040706 [Ensete ventricosum]